MPINTLIRRLPEVGRIRMGAKGQKGEPRRLEFFRLTSQDRTVLEAAAKHYGGVVRKWESQWELFTQRAEIPILLVPQMPPSQWFELWSAGGCQRRCDGYTEQLTDSACLCDPERRECKMTTRVSVMLPDLPGIGVWRFESHGYYAATELPMMLDLLLNEAREKRFPSASIAIEQRVIKRNNTTKKFPVATIRIRENIGALLAGQKHLAIPAAPRANEVTGEVIEQSDLAEEDQAERLAELRDAESAGQGALQVEILPPV